MSSLDYERNLALGLLDCQGHWIVVGLYMISSGVKLSGTAGVLAGSQLFWGKKRG